MRSRLLLALALGAKQTAALEEAALHAEGNPHDASSAASCCPAQALPPATLLVEAALLTRQSDTFVRVRSRKHHGVPVEVFTFRQPARLSPRVLPFDLALVADVDPAGIVEVPAPPADAADSWFPDYSWSHFVVCASAGGEAAKHLGWRFSRKPGAAGFGPASFVALIVRSEGSEVEPTAALGAREPLAAAVAVSDDAPFDAEPSDAETAEPMPLPVGMDAPAWMLKMVVAITARATSAREL